MLTEFANQIPAAVNIGEKLWGKFSPDLYTQIMEKANHILGPDEMLGGALILLLATGLSVLMAKSSYGYKSS